MSSIDGLLGEAKNWKSSEDFVASLVSQIKASSPTNRDLEYSVGALRTAVDVYLGEKNVDIGRCSFCGKSRDEVRTLLVSSESSICDECVATALHTMSHQKGQWYLRVAFLIFRAVASSGRFLISRGKK